MAFNINDATADTDHVEEAMREPFHLSAPASLPPEAISAADYLSRTPVSDIVSGWKSQIRRLKDLVHACEPMQAEWDRATPRPLRDASSGIKSVARPHLMSQFGLGGSRWTKQFIYGFEFMGAFCAWRIIYTRRESGQAGFAGPPVFGRIISLWYES